ncbi:MAG: PA domain-containing protein [Bryobacteraceae bacterium]|nr:PA domain-containing protein [Bryobacteraceae bacterium]
MFVKSKLILALLTAGAAFAADVVVFNADGPGVGFNDPTPATPVGGNPGTTVGQQALNVFEEAARRWGAKLVSTQPILIIATFTPLSCTATSAALGAAAPNWYYSNLPAANGGKDLVPNTWYPAALAEKLTRVDVVIDPNDPFEIFTLFNSRLGQPGCLQNSGWYYGLDNNEPLNRIDLLAVVLHEFGHGLGFTANPTSAGNGARFGGRPSIWEYQMLDVTTNKRWIDMTNAERAASARNNLNLVWTGKSVTNVIPSVLDPRLEVDTHGSSALPSQEAFASAFGPPVTKPVNGKLVAPADGGGVSPADGCEPFPLGANVAGNVVLVDRGNCTFVQKVLNAQAAGATAVIIANNAPGPLVPGGASTDVTIPSAGVTQAFGTALRAANPAPNAALRTSALTRIGTTAGYVRLYAPLTFAGGSSVSHWDISATRNLLMEPFFTRDSGESVKHPDDLTLNLLRDIGW